MELEDQALYVLNEIFKRYEIPITSKKLYIYRPVLHEPPYDKIEPIYSIERVFSCSVIYIVLEMTFQGRFYEYEAHFHVEDENIDLDELRLNYCQYEPHEDVRDIERKMDGHARLVCSYLSKIMKHLWLKRKS